MIKIVPLQRRGTFAQISNVHFDLTELKNVLSGALLEACRKRHQNQKSWFCKLGTKVGRAHETKETKKTSLIWPKSIMSTVLLIHSSIYLYVYYHIYIYTNNYRLSKHTPVYMYIYVWYAVPPANVIMSFLWQGVCIGCFSYEFQSENLGLSNARRVLMEARRGFSGLKFSSGRPTSSTAHSCAEFGKLGTTSSSL